MVSAADCTHAEEPTASTDGGGCRSLAVFAPWVIMALYLAVAVAMCVRRGYHLDADGTSYLYLASQLAAGRLGGSVSGHWSPLFTWGIAGLQALGTDPFVAARSLLIVSGGVWLWSVWRLAANYGLRPATAMWASLVVAMWAARYTSAKLQPDLLLAALLTLCFVCVTDRRFGSRTGLGLGAGLLAGFAYLAKAYALPFSLVHYALVCAIRSHTDAPALPGTNPRCYGRAWLVGTGAMVVVAAPWIGVLSARYGGFTFSTCGEVMSRFASVDREEDCGIETLWVPRPGVLSAWVDPCALLRDHPEVLNPPMGLKARLRMVLDNIEGVRGDATKMDFGCLALAAFCCLPVVVWRYPRFRGHGSFAWAPWTLVTVALYIGGLLLVATALMQRYLLPVWPLLLLNLFALIEGPRTASGDAETSNAAGGGGSRLRVALAATAVVSLLLGRVPSFVEDWRGTAGGRLVQDREMAGQLVAMRCTGPLAGGWKSNRGLYLAYWAQMQFYGAPRQDVPGLAVREMEQAGVRTFVAVPGSPVELRVRGRPGWRQLGHIQGAQSGDGGRTSRYAVFAYSPGSR